jgi:hypothetical protein
MKRLTEIAPKPDPVWDTKRPFYLQVSPIRLTADSFISWLGDDFPTDQKELWAVLWVFGEMLCGGMEKQLNSYSKMLADAAACQINPIYVQKEI